MTEATKSHFLDQGSAEWLEHRRKYRNASEAPVVMGESPWLNATQLALMKLGKKDPPAENEAMRHGKRCEPRARLLAETILRKSFSPFVVTHGEYSASLDGLTQDGEEIMEIKSPVQGCKSGKWLDVELGRCPMEDYWQLIHQLMASQAKRNYYVLYCSAHAGEDHVAICTVERNLEDEERLRNGWDWFQSFLDKNELPPPSPGYVVKKDAAWKRLARKWISARKRLKEAEESERAIRAEIAVLADNRNTIGGNITVQFYYKRGAVDYAAIPELSGVDLEKYRKEGRLEMKIQEAAKPEKP